MLLVAAAATMVLMVGAGVAYATGATEDSSGQSTGPGMDQAKSVALDHVDGSVTGSEFQDEEGYYEVEVTKPDGSQVDVHLDKNFNIINVQSDGGGSDSEDGPNDSNESNDSGGG